MMIQPFWLRHVFMLTPKAHGSVLAVRIVPKRLSKLRTLELPHYTSQNIPQLLLSYTTVREGATSHHPVAVGWEVEQSQSLQYNI